MGKTPKNFSRLPLLLWQDLNSKTEVTRKQYYIVVNSTYLNIKSLDLNVYLKNLRQANEPHFPWDSLSSLVVVKIKRECMGNATIDMP